MQRSWSLRRIQFWIRGRVIPKPGAVQPGEGSRAGPPIASSDVISNRQPLLAHFAPKLPAIGKSLLPIARRALSSSAVGRPMPLEEPVTGAKFSMKPSNTLRCLLSERGFCICGRIVAVRESLLRATLRREGGFYASHQPPPHPKSFFPLPSHALGVFSDWRLGAARAAVVDVHPGSVGSLTLGGDGNVVREDGRECDRILPGRVDRLECRAGRRFTDADFQPWRDRVRAYQPVVQVTIRIRACLSGLP